MELESLEHFKKTACDHLPRLTAGDFDWGLLHGRHVERLAAAWSAILREHGLGALVIHSGRAQRKYSRDDQYWPMVLTPHFNHWLPYEETPALLVFQTDSTPRLYFERHNSFWESPGSTNSTWNRTHFKIEQVSELSAVQIPSLATFIGDDLQLATALGFSHEQCNRDDVLNAADYLRTLKSEFEVACILRANELASVGHAALRDKFLGQAVSELELQHLFLASTAQTDQSLPYGSIVALGANAGVLHHVNYDPSTRKGDQSLLVDAGVKFNGYCSDITRTWARGGGGSVGLFRELIAAVDHLQQRLVALFTVGGSYEELHNRSHEMIARALIGIGLVTCSAEAAVETGLTRVFFPHGLGHSLGLQVHDVGMRVKIPAANNKYLRNTSTITQGQVVTIEPGIYFIPMLLKSAFQADFGKSINQKQLDLLAPFGGIRIEDNILANAQGPINLSISAPRIVANKTGEVIATL